MLVLVNLKKTTHRSDEASVIQSAKKRKKIRQNANLSSKSANHVFQTLSLSWAEFEEPL